jgi:hypothetical protein
MPLNSPQHMLHTAALIALSTALLPWDANANTSAVSDCYLPKAYVVPERPQLQLKAHESLSVTLERNINVASPVFQRWFYESPLSDLLPGTQSMPSVSGTKNIGAIVFPAAGSRRVVCLADGSIAIEEVLTYEPNRGFSYIVWGYTLKAAEPIAYGFGEFWFDPTAEKNTRLKWRYSFALKDDQFPGSWGAVGRTLFRWTFLESKYTDFMNAGLDAMVQRSEKTLR